MTTVGYGERYPISAEGRLVAVFLMAAGVDVFGTLTGLVASWFLSPAEKKADSDLHEIRVMLVDMRRQLDAIAPARTNTRALRGEGDD